jgi:predicted dehydrogenase
MIHDVDLALHLNGPVAKVTAQGVVDDGMIVFASANLVHRNGRFSRIQASRITDRKIRMIQATCGDMFVNCDLLRKEISISRQAEFHYKEGVPVMISSVEETVAVRPGEALLAELQAFVASCSGGDWSGAPGVDAAVDAMAVCNAIQDEVRASGAL